MGLADELQKLQELRQSGALSTAEFEQAKAALLREAGVEPAPRPAPSPAAPAYLNIKHDDRSGLGKGVERGFEKVANDATQGCVKVMLGLVLTVVLLAGIGIYSATRCSTCKGSGKCTSSMCVGGRTLLLTECSTCHGTAQCPTCHGSGW